MKPDNQNIDQPDYSFITDQPGGPAPKKTDKKMVIIFVLIIILAILGVVSVVFSNTQKSVQKEEKSSTSTTKTEAVDVVDEFFKRAVANDAEGAYSLFSTDTIITKEVFINESFPFLRKMDLSGCKLKEEEPQTDDQGRAVKSYICYSTVGNFEYEYVFTITSAEAGNSKILYYNLAVSDEE